MYIALETGTLDWLDCMHIMHNLLLANALSKCCIGESHYLLQWESAI